MSSAIERVIAAATTVAVSWGLRQQQPQKYLPSRIGLFYLLLWLLAARRRKTRALAWFAQYGMVYYLMVSVSRFAPNLLRLPASLTGKSSTDGKIPFWRKLVNLPYHALEHRMFQYVVDTKVKTRKLGLDPYNKIGEKMYLGVCPTLLQNDIPDDVDMVCDVCNEYENSKVRTCDYACFPIWDQSVPTDLEQFLRFVDRIAKYRGTIYFHCAFGIGRSSLIAAAVMVKRGLVKTPEEALKVIRKERPFVHWGDEPRAFMQSIAKRLAE